MPCRRTVGPTGGKIRRNGLRVRLWVIGAALVFCGFATHEVFNIWVDEFAGRIEMGRFAGFEIMLFTSGLGLSFLSLIVREECDRKFRLVGWLSWVVALFASAWTVLEQLPP
jgi:hypothetical protein